MRLSYRVLIPVLVFTGVLALYASKEFQPPKVSNASTYPARDAHTDEKVTVAADPYNTSAKAAIFRLKYLDKGVLPINLIVSNDGTKPVSMTKLQVQFVTKERHAKLTPLDEEDLFRIMAHARRTDDVARTTNPLPLPRTHKVGGLKQEDQDEIERSRFAAEAVEPNTTHAGFVYFDVSGLDSPLDGATLFVSGVKDSSGNELMYFEIPLSKAQ